MAPIKVLVIEDHPATLELYARVLNRAQYEVYQAATIAEARDLLRQHQFKLILCDVEVGSERSLTMLKELKSTLEDAGTGVIALSAQEQYRRAADDAGVEFFLSKPVSIRALVNLIDRVTVGKFERSVPLILDTREMMRAKSE